MKKTIFLLTILSLLHTAFSQNGHFPVPFRCCNKWGFVKYGTKTPITAFEYDTVGVFSESRAWVKKGKLYGYIDKKGILAIPIMYEKASNFVFGQALITKNGREFHIDENGEEQAKPKWACSNVLQQGTSSFDTYKVGKKYGLLKVHKNLKYTQALYDSIVPTLPGAFVLQEKKWGLISFEINIDTMGLLIWDKVQKLKNVYLQDDTWECFAVCQNDKWAIVDMFGKYLTPYKYEAIGKFFDDQNLTTTVKPFGRKWGFIDMNGTEYFEETEEGCSE